MAWGCSIPGCSEAQADKWIVDIYIHKIHERVMHDGDPIISYKKNTTIGLRHVMTLDRQICATNEIVEEYKAVLEVGIRNVYFMRCFSSLPH